MYRKSCDIDPTRSSPDQKRSPTSTSSDHRTRPRLITELGHERSPNPSRLITELGHERSPNPTRSDSRTSKG
ncbi:hypothetical protein ACFW2D_24075 [Streptomyces sp. NPDC058914]|uniref:hypothetical protein n=1 Tax=Streptomyces sp. NPDC058914 TaxID=3346671 RepID=UPI0036C33351